MNSFLQIRVATPARLGICLLLVMLASVAPHSRSASGSVLVIGDSISLGWMPHAQALLPEVDFVHAFDGAGMNNHGTKLALTLAIGAPTRRIDFFVESAEPWDLIIYNSGIHDMRSDSWHGTTSTEYRENLNEIYDVLEAQGAPILWLTTTPIPSDAESADVTLQPGHRAVAIEIANERADGVVDLFDAIYDEVDQFQLAPQNVHFNESGYAFLANFVADAVASPENASEFYYTEGDAPLWPEGIFNPDYVPPPPPLFTGVDFLRWQRNPEGLHATSLTDMPGDEFLSWQRVEGSRPLYQRTPVNGADFLRWQLHETELRQNEAGTFIADDYLGWQRFGSRSFEGVFGEIATEGPEGILAVPEPAAIALSLLATALLMHSRVR